VIADDLNKQIDAKFGPQECDYFFPHITSYRDVDGPGIESMTKSDMVVRFYLCQAIKVLAEIKAVAEDSEIDEAGLQFGRDNEDIFTKSGG
jgi:hypothetical protein